MFSILIRNHTERALSLCETMTVEPGTGRVVAVTPDIIMADRLIAVAGVGALMDFSVEDRRRFVVVATEFGCELDHPDHGRISVTIFDSQACELGVGAKAADPATESCGN